MSAWSRFRSWFGGSANQEYPGEQRPDPGQTVHEDAPVVGVDGALQISTVWACVTLLVENISSLPLVVYRGRRGGEREIARDTRIYQVLHDRPNRRQTGQEFWEQMLLNFFLRGNAYARKVTNGGGDVLELWPMSADQMSVTVTDDNELVYTYQLQNRQLVFMESDILHLRGPGNGVIGMSQLDYMRSSAGLAIKAQDHTNKTFRKNARRPGLLMTDAVLTAEQREKLKKNFGDIVQGTSKELYLLEANMKFEALGMSPADIQLLETRKYSVQDLARRWRIPPVLIGDASETTALGSSVQQIIELFYKTTLRPQLTRIEKAIEARVLTARDRARTLHCEFNLNALLRASIDQRYDIYGKAVQNGVMSRNEARRLENLPPYDGGDVFTAQTNLFPVEQLGQQPSQGGVPPEPIEQ